MGFELYIKTLQKIFNQIELKELLDKLDNDTLKFVNKYLKDNITLRNGKIEVTPETTKAIKRFNRVMDKFFNENKNLEKYLVESSKLIRNAGETTLEFHKGQVKGFNYTRMRSSYDLITNEYLDSIKGLNEEFKNPIRSSIVDNLTMRKSFTTIQSEMKRLIIGDEEKKGLMNRYLKTNARTAAGAYNGATNQYFYDKHKSLVKYIGVSGGIVSTSAPQCIISVKEKGQVLKGFNKKTNEKFSKYTNQGFDSKISIEDFNKTILPLADDNGLIEGTTIDNVFTNRLHWGCRHDFTPLIN